MKTIIHGMDLASAAQVHNREEHMTTTRYCRDYGGTLGLTCGYWAKNGSSIDRHVMRHHPHDPDVFDINRPDQIERNT